MPKQPPASQPKKTPRRGVKYEVARLEALFASIGEGIIVTDAEGRIERINDTAAEMMGYKKQEMLGQRFLDIFVSLHPDGTTLAFGERAIAQALLSERTVSRDMLYRRKDGSVLPAGITVSPMLLDSEPIGAIQLMRDLTSEIESDKMKSDFISVASHQLRTPLSSINIYARMLKDGLAGDLNSRQRLFVNTILSSTQRMNELITTLLNITRIDAGGIAVDSRPLKLQTLVADTVAESMPLAAKKQIKLVASLDTDLPPISTDGLLVKEVLSNFLSNALKYTPPGGEVLIRLAAVRRNFVLSVTDTGMGIPKAAQKHIFTKFFRADNILTQDVTGTGLGLYLTRAIAEHLDGDVWFESVEGKGSTFYLSLPKRGSLNKKGRFKLGA
jgi:PAS domain S-box-containing protein